MDNETMVKKNECILCSPKIQRIEGEDVMGDGKQYSNDYAQIFNIDLGEIICNSCKEKINAWGGSINYRTPVREKTNYP
ncbi:MAG: hypothetical protein WBC60_04110 [Cognaticolwellia sp.]